MLGLDELTAGLADAGELLSMAVEEDDADTVDELVSDLDRFEKTVGGLEFRRMFSARWIPTTPISISSRAREAPRLRTGPI